MYVGSTFAAGDFSGYEDCGQYSGSVGLGLADGVDCSPAIDGRYVAVQILGTNEELTICEVFAYTAYEGYYQFIL